MPARRSLLAAAAMLVLAAVPAPAGRSEPALQPVSHNPPPIGQYWLTYSVSVIGLPIAEANLIVDYAADSYNGLLDIQTVGLAGLVAPYAYRGETAGTRDGRLLHPNEHITTVFRAGQERQLEIFYGADGPDRIVYDPPRQPKANRGPVTPDMLPGTLDIVSALLTIFQADTEHGPQCQPPLPVYDGQLRFDLHMRRIAARRLNEGPFQGRARGCRLSIEALGGFRTDDEEINFEKDYDAWYADVLGDGFNMLIRVESDLTFGPSAIRLKQVRDFDGRALVR